MFDTSQLIFIAIIAFIICFFFGLRYFLKYKHRERMIKDFADYTSVLQFHMEKAYDIIHKDRVLIYSLEATTVPEDKINVASKDFVTLVEKLIGPRLRKEFIFLYGNYETFVFTMIEYFNTRYEDDEIRKTTVSDMMDSDISLEG
jgi:hypothetical protein